MKYIQYDRDAFVRSPYFQRLSDEERFNFRVLTQVFHFKVNNHVLDSLINWEAVPSDPIYKLVFPRPEMLEENDFAHLARFAEHRGDDLVKEIFLKSLRVKYKPFVRYSEDCIPRDAGQVVPGAYHSSRHALFLFPKPMVRTCHAYCSYCFRWASFDDYEAQSFSYSDPHSPVGYLENHPEISEVLFTGADPITLRAGTIARFIEPLLKLDSLKAININTKSLAYWPYRFTEDSDADDLLGLFSKVVASGKSLNLCAHFSHDRELSNASVVQAAERILATGAAIRTQGPIIVGINDTADAWASMWNRQIELGMNPKYMFIEAGHSPVSPFRVPLSKALGIFQAASEKLGGQPGSIKGPMFMNEIYYVALTGRKMIDGQPHLALQCLESPPGHNLEGEVRFVPYDEQTSELGDFLSIFKKDLVMA